MQTELRLKRPIAAVLLTLAVILGSAATAEATTWYTYSKQVTLGPCGYSKGVTSSGTVSQSARTSSSFLISRTYSYTATQIGMSRKYYDVRHFNNWRKVHSCETVNGRVGQNVVRSQRANPVTNCWIDVYYMGAYFSSAWSSGSC